jgi:hypothetical protein
LQLVDGGEGGQAHNIISVSAGSGSVSPPTTTQEPVVVSILSEKVETIPDPEPAVPEVSLLDTNKVAEGGMSGGETGRRPSHGFVVGAGGDEEPALTVTPAASKEPETSPTNTLPPPTGAKTYANLFKSGLPPNSTGSSNLQFSSRSPFPARPSGGSTTVSIDVQIQFCQGQC